MIFLSLFLPTAYIVRREGNVFTRVCPSIHLFVHGGYPGQVQPGGGYPSQVQLGVPHLRYPPVRPGQEVPLLGVPHLGYPIRIGWGYPCWGKGYPYWGVPHLAGGYPTLGPPHQTWLGGGTPPWVTDGVLDTPRSVCLLRSRRRTFLFLFVSIQQNIEAAFFDLFTCTSKKLLPLAHDFNPNLKIQIETDITDP